MLFDGLDYDDRIVDNQTDGQNETGDGGVKVHMLVSVDVI